jgi:hypothetical protein
VCWERRKRRRRRSRTRREDRDSFEQSIVRAYIDERFDCSYQGLRRTMAIRCLSIPCSDTLAVLDSAGRSRHSDPFTMRCAPIAKHAVRMRRLCKREQIRRLYMRSHIEASLTAVRSKAHQTQHCVYQPNGGTTSRARKWTSATKMTYDAFVEGTFSSRSTA